MITKKCNRCQEIKTADKFHKDKTTKLGLYGFCKVCKAKATSKFHYENLEHRRNSQLKRNYGITLEDYRKMKEAQNNCCATCNRNENELKRSLMVDHCHDSGKIRGLLCDECNLALGKIEDNIKTLENMILYLNKKP